MESIDSAQKGLEEVTTRNQDLHDQVHAILVNELIEFHRRHPLTPEIEVAATQPEVPYDYYGHKGSIDLVEWIHTPAQPILCTYEIKSKIFTLEEAIRKFKEKAEFFPRYLEKEQRIASVAHTTFWNFLVLLDSYENGKLILDHFSTFESIFGSSKGFLSGRSQHYLATFDPLRPIFRVFFLHDSYDREAFKGRLVSEWAYKDTSDFLNKVRANQGYLL